MTWSRALLCWLVAGVLLVALRATEPGAPAPMVTGADGEPSAADAPVPPFRSAANAAPRASAPAIDRASGDRCPHSLAGVADGATRKHACSRRNSDTLPAPRGSSPGSSPSAGSGASRPHATSPDRHNSSSHAGS